MKVDSTKPRSRKFRTKGKFMNNVSRKPGGTTTEYEDENPEIWPSTSASARATAFK
jgi:hypothetical protein